MPQFYYRPIVQSDVLRPSAACPLAGGRSWFSHVEVRQRGGSSEVVPADEVPTEALVALTSARGPVCGVALDVPVVMGVLNVTPDSFSDGGEHNAPDRAVERAAAMVKEGAQIIDIGGESTRPGADFVEMEQELDRTIPIIRALCESGVRAAVSIDTRKAAVAKAALAAGAQMFNDVSALSFDPDSLPLAVAEQPFACLMHAQGAPKTMQDNPEYSDVTLDVYDYLQERVLACVDAGLAKDRIVIDPGIGFGKTTEHNLQLLRDLSIFHGLGCPILLGVSRKRFIGVIGSAQEPAQRAPGSIAVALEGLRQGVQITRVHDVWQTKQAFALWQAMQ